MVFGDTSDIVILVCAVLLAMVLGIVVVLIIQSSRGNAKRLENNSAKENKQANPNMNFNKQDIMKFMEFDKIEDDMIIRENRKCLCNGA